MREKNWLAYLAKFFGRISEKVTLDGVKCRLVITLDAQESQHYYNTRMKCNNANFSCFSGLRR